MDDIGENGLLRHDIPVSLWVRLIFVAIGLCVIMLSTWELHPGLWPVNIFSPFFLFIMLGAVCVGGSAILAGILGRAASWTVGPGNITIVEKSPFFSRSVHFTPDAVSGFEIREREPMEGDNTWCVVLVAHNGERLETRDYGSVAAAERLRDQIEHLFRAEN